MAYIPGADAGAQWGSRLLQDLTFIKKHLRYPFSKKTLPGTVVVTIFLLFMLRFMGLLFFVRTNAYPVIKWLIIPLLIIIIFGAFYRYYRTLKFTVIATPFVVAENMKLVAAFLLSQHLVMYRHPDAPEVFQIISRPLGNTGNGQREVMIFIADDKRVLVNSHFVNVKYTINPPSANAGNMARRLREWIKIHYPGAQSLTIV